jgi:hypothetical protein
MTKKSNSLAASLATAAGKRQPLPQQGMTNSEGNAMGAIQSDVELFSANPPNEGEPK